MSKTKHLDTAIDILKGSLAAKRAPRKAQVELEMWASSGTYTISSNGRVLEAGEGTPEYAKERADARAAAIRALGKTCILMVY